MLIWPVTRFVAGEESEAAIAAARERNALGITATLDLLGENVTDPGEAARAREAYEELLRAIHRARVDANISIKLTMLGLDISPRLAEDNLRQLLDVAGEVGNWVRIDMEASRYTQLTLEIFTRVWESHQNVGVVVQSMLRRSADDVERLNAMGARVRLVKGAYREPAPLAIQSKREVNDAFDRLAERLLDEGHDPAIATHDDARIRHVMAYAVQKGIASDRYEFQMLYGIRSRTQAQLVEQGYRMRVYIPFGERWLPYFYRRLRERNANVAFVLRNLVRS